MDGLTALQERKQLFENAFDFKPNSRVPLIGNFWTWKYLDAGYQLKDALYDYDILYQVNSDFHQTYGYDAYMDVGTRNPMRIAQALGGGLHYVDELTGDLLIDDNVTLRREEYQEFMDDPNSFYWSKYLPRVSKPGLTLGELRQAVLEFMAFGEFAGRINDHIHFDLGAMTTIGPGVPAIGPLDSMFIGLRGMRELATDVVRYPERLKEVCDRIFDRTIAPTLASAGSGDMTPYVGAVGSVFFSHSMLNPKQFENLFWPYIKPVIDVAIEKQLRMFIFCESEMLRFAEFFEDIPKGVLMVHVEQDDIFEYRKRLPNIAVSGGMPTRLMGLGTPKECVDYAKNLIDELGEGFVFSQDKMMSYQADATRENLLAINEFVKGYSY